MSDQKLIMLMGLPRSGTTWLGKIFDSHPETLYRHEPDSYEKIAGVPILPAVADTELYRNAITGFAARLPFFRATKVTSSLPVFPKQYYSSAQLALRRLAVFSTKLAGRVLGELPVPEVVTERTLLRQPLVWKSIESVGRLGVLSRILSAAPTVHILRHPCGYIASVLHGESAGQHATKTRTDENFSNYAALLETEPARRRGLTMEQLRQMPAVARLAWRWVLYNEKAAEDTRGRPNCMLVLYEDVCKDPRAHAQRLFGFADLGWNPQTETFIRSSTTSNQDAYYSIVRDPLKSAFKWQKQLPAADIDVILSVVESSPLGKLYP
jgi:hypothetical protein